MFAPMSLALLLAPTEAEAGVYRDGAYEIPLTIRVVDKAGEPVPTAVVRHRVEKIRHGVNAKTGKWRAERLWMPDGTDPVFAKGTIVEFDAFAPGFEARTFRYKVVARHNVVEIPLEPLRVDLTVAAAPSVATPEVFADLGDLRKADPELSLAYAVHLANLGPAHAEDALTWGELAASEAKALQGDAYVDFQENLFRLRTTVRHQQWENYDRIRADVLAPMGSSIGEASDRARRRTARLAEEWLWWAEAVGRDTTVPRGVCLSASEFQKRCH